MISMFNYDNNLLPVSSEIKFIVKPIQNIIFS